MKKYEEVLKGNNLVQNAFALEYLLINGRGNLLDDKYYENLQGKIKSNDDKGSLISNEFALGALEIARDMAKLDTKELCEYIYDEEKHKKRQERSR